MADEIRSSKKKSLRSEVLIFLAVFVVVFCLWLGGWQWIDHYIVGQSTTNETTAQARGLFGDKFGAINALFAGFAFAGIILTLLLQRGDLKEQNEARSRQQFDNTFFQLLNLHIDITAKLSDLQQEGRAAFKAFNERIKASDGDFHVFCALQKLGRDEIRKIRDARAVEENQYPELSTADVSNLAGALQQGTSAFDNYLDEDVKMHERKIKEAYTRACIQHIDNFSHYFRNLYHILKFIADSDLISHEEKIAYSKFVRSQLSDVELVALFYNSITKIELPGREKMELGYGISTLILSVKNFFIQKKKILFTYSR